jgi:hypothetical protein
VGVTQPPVKLRGDSDRYCFSLLIHNSVGPKKVAVGVEYADCGGIWIRNVLVNTSEEGDFFNIQRSNCRLFLTVLALSMEP